MFDQPRVIPKWDAHLQPGQTNMHDPRHYNRVSYEYLAWDSKLKGPQENQARRSLQRDQAIVLNGFRRAATMT
jgi:hypothetical protein